MTETELAERLDLSRNQLYNIKRGHSGTSPDTIGRLVQVFSLATRGAIEELYDLAGFKAPRPSYEGDRSVAAPDIHALIDALNPDDRDDLVQLAQTKWRRTHPGMPLPARSVDQPYLSLFPRSWVLFNPDANTWHETNGQEITDKYRVRSLVTLAMQRPTIENIEELLEQDADADSLV